MFVITHFFVKISPGLIMPWMCMTLVPCLGGIHGHGFHGDQDDLCLLNFVPFDVQDTAQLTHA